MWFDIQEDRAPNTERVPYDVYALTGIAPGTPIQIQNTSDNHDVRIYYGNAVPTEKYDYYKLVARDWQEFCAESIMMWCWEGYVRIVVHENHGAEFCHKNIGAGTVVTNEPPVLLPIITGTYSTNSDWSINVIVDEATSGTPGYVEYCAKLKFLHPDQNGRVVTLTGSSLSATPTVVDTNSVPTLSVVGTMGNFTMDDALNDIYGAVEIELCVTDSAGEMGTVLALNVPPFSVSGSVDDSSDYVYIVDINEAVNGVQPYGEYTILIEMLHPDQNGRTITITGSDLTTAPAVSGGTIVDTAGVFDFTTTGLLSSDGTVSIGGVLTPNGALVSAFTGTLGYFEIAASVADMYGDINVTVVANDSVGSTTGVNL